MSVNRHPTNPSWWQVHYYPDGSKGKREVIVVKGGTREYALEIEAELRREARGAASVSLFPSIGEVIPVFLSSYKLDHIDAGKVARHLERWNREIGRYKFSAITVPLIEDYKHRRLADGIKPATINKELSALSCLCKWAQERGYCAEIKIKRFPAKLTKPAPPDVPTREEVLALINAMIWPRCGLFACLYYGGLRANEARHLSVEHVYLDREIMLVLGKGRKFRFVPILDDLKPFLTKRIREVKTGLLWTTRNGKPITDLDAIIERAKRRAGMTRHFYPHLLRHAFGTHATMAGVNMRQLQNAMGHSTVTTTEIYTTLASEAVVSELKKMNKTK